MKLNLGPFNRCVDYLPTHIGQFDYTRAKKCFMVNYDFTNLQGIHLIEQEPNPDGIITCQMFASASTDMKSEENLKSKLELRIINLILDAHRILNKEVNLEKIQIPFSQDIEIKEDKIGGGFYGWCELGILIDN